MTFHSIDQWWWPYVFIALGGWLATDLWRFVGVFLGGRIADGSDILVLVRCVATALVAGVIANLIVFPGGALAATPLVLRIAAAAVGFAAYLTLGRHIIVGIVVGEAVLIAGVLL
jgi:hypothetical protein